MKCVHCQHQFSFKERMMASWKPTTNYEIHCPECGKKQYISNKSVAKSYGILLLVEFIIMLLAPLIKLSMPLIVLLLIVAIILVVILMPLSLKLVVEKDGLLERQFKRVEDARKER